MDDVSRLINKHLKDMSRWDKEMKKEQRRRNQREKRMAKLMDSAMRHNVATSAKEQNFT